MTRILIADDHAIMRSGVEFLLSGEPSIEIVGFCNDGEQALARALELLPDIVILDLVLPKLPGLVVLERLLHANPRPNVIAVSGQASGLIFKEALDLGADALVSKEDDSDELLAAIHAVENGDRYLSNSVAKLIGPLSDTDSAKHLTPREREVLSLVAEARSNEEIGEKLGISPKTAKKHRENIRAKLGVSSAVEAAQAAVRLGLAKIS